MQRPPAILLALALVGAGTSGCSGTGSGNTSPGLTGSRGTGSVPIPGDTRRAGREGLAPPAPTLTAAEIEQRRARSVAVAEQLWQNAEAVEARNPGGAADAYREIAEDHPESPRAAEAKFREGRGRYRSHDYRDAFEAFRRYIEIAPTSPHLAEVEEMVFESGKRYLASIRGLSGIFKSEDEGYAMLQWVPATFPNGRLADDALLTLGDALYREEDKDNWIEAVQHYRMLLLHYPESDLRAAAYLGLARTYMVRDQGAAWHGGYVDLDPREPKPKEAAELAFAGAVKSAPGLALEAYEDLLYEAERRPGSVTPAQVAAAEQGVRAAKERLAAKESRIAAVYGNGRAADPYLRSAAELRGQPAPPALPPHPAPPSSPPSVPPSTPPATPPVPPSSTQPPVPPPSQPQPSQPPPTQPQPTQPPVTPPPQPPGTSTPVTPPPVPGTTDPFPVAGNTPPSSSPPAVSPPGVPASLPPPKIRRTTPAAPR